MKFKDCIKGRKEKWILVLILLIGSIVSTAIFLQDMKKCHLEQGYILRRPVLGEGEKEEVLKVETPYGEETIHVQVQEQRLSSSEIQEKLQNIAESLEERILGENLSLDKVCFSLNLIQELEDWPVNLEWSVQENGYVYSDGTLNQENLPQDGAVTKLTARLTWGDEVIIREIYVRVVPERQSAKEAYLEHLQEDIEKKATESQYLNVQELPKTIGGMPLNWRRPQDYRGIFIGMLFVAAAVLFVLSGQSRENQLVQKKQIQMEMDYPEVVSKLKLYMEAGLTCRSAWMKISEDYQKKRQVGSVGKRSVYEEMVKTGYEMQSGVSELRAYERFGDKCGMAGYKRLTGLLIQNVRKGNSGLGQLLESEMWQAFETRKMLARKQGEEAGTKLLLPMMGMLGIVMAIVIAPAFMSMQM